MNDDLIRRILIASEGDYAGEIHWVVNRKKGELLFFADCSDFFDLASADSEPIETEADVQLLEKTLRDLQIAEGTSYPAELTILYAARRRGICPRLLRNIPDTARELFEEISHAPPPR